MVQQFELDQDKIMIYKREQRPFFLALVGRVGVVVVVSPPETEITNQLDKLNKRLLDIDASFGGCLKEGNLPRLGQFLTILQGDLSFLLQITLVSTKNHGVGRRLLVAQNKISHFVDGIKTSLRCHTVDQKESLSGINVLFSHNLSF